MKTKKKQVFEIEKGVPYEPKLLRKPCNYPYAQMEVGDSFLVPIKNGVEAIKIQRRMTASVGQWRRLNAPEKRFATSQTEEGIRVWRID